MKKTKHTFAVAAALAAAAAGLVSCKAPETAQQKVYGPPSDSDVSTSAAESAPEVSQESKAGEDK